MAFVDEFKALCMFVGREIRDFFEDQSRFLKPLAIVSVVMFAAAGGYVGYRYYVVSQEQDAHRSFVQYLETFQTAQQANNSQEWERMVSLFESGYQEHKQRNVAPLFLAMKADAQLQLGQQVESINTLQRAVDALPQKSKLYPMLATKQALMQLDSDDDALSKDGLAQLVSLARDTDNSLQDMALYYLGRYYWAQDKIEDAKKVWQDLEDSSWSQKAYPSPWVAQAQQSLQQLAA